MTAVKSGFTLIEMLVWMSIVGLVIGAAMLLLNQGTHAYLFGSARVAVQQDARGELEPILRAIRNASFVIEAQPNSFVVMAADGMRVSFNSRETIRYIGAHDEPEAVLLANPTLIKAITITSGPFQGTAALRNQLGTSTKEPENCSQGTYTPDGWNVFCR